MRSFASIALFTALTLPAHAAAPAELHASPEERLDRVDAGLIATAKTSIDFASYALNDRLVIATLDHAARRGVKIRIVLEPREPHGFVALSDLADNVRVKRGGPLMHLKAYAADGAVLHTGSANFSFSGENEQDNDLVVLRNSDAAAKFEAHSQRMWSVAEPMVEFGPCN